MSKNLKKLANEVKRARTKHMNQFKLPKATTPVQLRKNFLKFIKSNTHLSFKDMRSFFKEQAESDYDPKKFDRILMNQQAKCQKWAKTIKILKKRYFDVTKSSINSYSFKVVQKRRNEQKVHPTSYKRTSYYTSVWWITFSEHYLHSGDKCDHCNSFAKVLHHHNYRKTFYEDIHPQCLVKVCNSCHMKLHSI